MTEAQWEALLLPDYSRRLTDRKWLEGYSRTANRILPRTDLSDGAKVAYILLLDQARYHARRHADSLNGAWLGCRQLALRAGKTPRTFGRYVAELVAVGLAVATPGPCGTSTAYEVVYPVGEALRPGAAPLLHPGAAPLLHPGAAPHDPEQEEPEKNTSPDLLPETISFRVYLKREIKLRWTVTQMEYLDTAFAVGVRLSIAKALALGHILDDGPWKYRDRLLEAWKQWRRIVTAYVKVYILGKRARVSEADRDWVKPHMYKDEREWIEAHGPADAMPTTLREALGYELAAECDAAGRQDTAAAEPTERAELAR